MQTRKIVLPPRALASIAPRHIGRCTAPAMPKTTSFCLTPRSVIASFPAAASSSTFSIDRRNAASPPAIKPTTIDGSVQNVGGHSEASRTPSRPDVPAPT